MAPSNKIREEAVVPYRHIPAPPRSNPSNFVAQSMPMAAMFMKNKALAWSSLFIAVQAYLNEPKNKPITDASENAASASLAGNQPPFFQIMFGVIALLACYVDVFFPTAPIVKKVADAAATATGK